MSGVSTLKNLISLLAKNSEDSAIQAELSRLPSDGSYSPDDIAQLAYLLAGTGKRFTDRNHSVADVASTGGPSSLSTLLAPLFLCAADVKVAKLGVIGRPAGGIDSLSQIPGFRANLSMSEAEHILSNSGYVHFLAEGDAAPLDGRLFRLRQQSGTQSFPALVVASILAKKIAVGVTHAGLDIRVSPHGNFGKDWNSASENAHLFNATARLLHIEPAPVLTDGRYAYQPFLGRSESLVALHEIFSGNANDWLIDHFRLCRTLAQTCLPKEKSVDLAKFSFLELEAVFYSHIVAQGASKHEFERIVETTKKSHVFEITALNDGYCNYPLHELRSVLVGWQNQIAETGVLFPDPVGLVFHQRQGEWVLKGSPIATVRAIKELKDEAYLCLSNKLARPSNIALGSTFKIIYG